MSEFTAILAGGIALGALFDAYAYYRYKYAQREFELAQDKAGAAGAFDSSDSLDAGQKTLADEVDAEEDFEEGSRKSLAQRLREAEAEREESRRTRASEDSAVVFGSNEDGLQNETETAGLVGARVERMRAGGEFSGDEAEIGEARADSGMHGSIAALRSSISDLKTVLRKKSWRSGGSGGRGVGGGSVSTLGDSSDGASFSGVGSGDYSKGDYTVS